MASKNTPTCELSTDPVLLSELVCPLTGGPLVFAKEDQELISVSAKIACPIREGIPIMVQNEARELSEKEIAKLVR